MTSQPLGPARVVEEFLAAFEAMDFDRALTYVADDVEYTNIPIGTVKGHTGLREVLAPFFAPIHENQFVVLRRADSGPVVCVERLDRHRLGDGWRELPVTGVFEVWNDKIAVWREYFDLTTAAKIHEPGAA